MKVKALFKYRSVWMGCAMLWIVWYHLNASMPYPRSTLAMVGYGGVDVFLFASGIGCYHSLSKSTDLMGFYKRRFLRIMPTYFCFISFWIVYRMYVNPLALPDIIGNLFGIQFFSCRGNTFNWYISIILLLYALSPLFYTLARNVNHIYSQFFIVFLTIILSISFWDSSELSVGYTRISIFYIGMLFCKYSENDGIISKKFSFVLVLGFFIGIIALIYFRRNFPVYLWSKGLHWYPYIFITPGMCFGISVFSIFAEKVAFGKCILRVIKFIGDYSLEIYLMHIFFFEVIVYLVADLNILPASDLSWAIALLSTFLGSITLRWLTNTALRAASKLLSHIPKKA